MGMRIRIIIILLLSQLISGCSTYNSGFSCGDAKGVPCTPMERVDQLISSGEIESYVLPQEKCKGLFCGKSRKSLTTR